MSGKDIRESTQLREAYFLSFADKVRKEASVPLAVTGGFRSANAMDQALKDGTLDMVGIARPLAVDASYSNKLLAGIPNDINVNPIKTGIKAVDNMGLMEVAWYGRQLKRISEGRPTKPNENARVSFLKVAATTGFRTMKTKRLRAKQ